MTAMEPRPKCHPAEHPHVGVTDGGLTAGRPVEAGCTGCRRRGNDGHAGTECPDCGGQADPHAGHTGNGRVPACGEGRPPMRGAVCRCRHCDPTATSPGKCEPKGVGRG